MILLLCILKKLLFILEIINLYLELKFRAIGIGIQQFEQISLWAFVFLSDCLVLLSKKKLGKSLWANVHGQISFAQRTLNPNKRMDVKSLAHGVSIVGDRNSWSKERALFSRGR